jgi:hypothetical protein
MDGDDPKNCAKIRNRIECARHGYPLSEALYPDRKPDPLPCFRPDSLYEGWIEGVQAWYKKPSQKP